MADLFNIQNVAFPAQRADLAGGAFAPGTPIVGFGLAGAPANRLWRTEAALPGPTAFQNPATGSWATINAAAEIVVGGGAPEVFEVVNNINPDLGMYIQVPGTPNVWVLLDGANGTEIRLQPYNAANPAHHWRFVAPPV